MSEKKINIKEILNDERFEEMIKLAFFGLILFAKENELNFFLESNGWTIEDAEEECEKYIISLYPELDNLI